MSDIPSKPDKPCPGCKQDAWYWPGDYYVGKKQWLCQRCHPKPKEVDNGYKVLPALG